MANSRLNAANDVSEREPQEGFLDVPDGRLHYLDWGGDGLAAHFLHGTGFCAGTYTPFLKFLLNDLHVIATDVRGHGQSFPTTVRPIRHWRIFAEDVQRIISGLLPVPVIGMGHSLGAVATYIAAALHPHLFTAMVLIDPVIISRKRLWGMALARTLGLPFNRRLARRARKRTKVFLDKQSALERFTASHGIFKSWSAEFVKAYLECGLLEKDESTALLRCDPELEAQIFESVPLDVWTYAKRVRCPVLVLRGEHSDTFSTAAARRLEKLNAQFMTRTIPATSHFLTMEKPEACARAIAAFIRTLDLAPSPLSCGK